MKNIIDKRYKTKDNIIPDFCEIIFWVNAFILPCAESSTRSFVWFQILDAKLESIDAAIPEINGLEYNVEKFMDFWAIRKIIIAKNGKGEKIEYGV